MNKLIMGLAILFGLTTSAFAADFDKTGIALSAESDKFGVSLSTGATRDFSDDARALGVYTTSLPVNLGIQYIENGDVDDYRINAFKRANLEVGSVNLYGVAEAHYDFGDSYDKNELKLSPYVGAQVTSLNGFTPFVEAGYDFKSVEGDYFDFSRNDSYGKLGVDVPVTANTTLRANIIQKMDVDFNKTDREYQVAFNVNF